MLHSQMIDDHPAHRWHEASPDRQLHERGYCIVEQAVPPSLIAAIDEDLAPDFAATPFCQGGFYGARTKRFGRLLLRSRHADTLVRHPTVMTLIEAALAPFCDTIQLNLTQAIALHPGALPQLPHRDQDMWRGEIGRIEYLVNVMWPLTPYTVENGATIVWPESQGSHALEAEPARAPVAAEMKPGSALVFLGSTLHGAGGNATNEIRRGLVVSYCLGWLKPYENQWLAYPPAIAKSFPADLAALVGYRQHRPNLGNFEGRCPSILFDDEIPQRIGAIDALRPDQAAMVDAFVHDQRRQP